MTCMAQQHKIINDLNHYIILSVGSISALLPSNYFCLVGSKVYVNELTMVYLYHRLERWSVFLSAECFISKVWFT
jgi:hypothetical protein